MNHDLDSSVGPHDEVFAEILRELEAGVDRDLVQTRLATRHPELGAQIADFLGALDALGRAGAVETDADDLPPPRRVVVSSARLIRGGPWQRRPTI